MADAIDLAGQGSFSPADLDAIDEVTLQLIRRLHAARAKRSPE